MELEFVCLASLSFGYVSLRVVKRKKYVPVTGWCTEVVAWDREIFPRKRCKYQYRCNGRIYEYWEKGYYYHVPKMEEGMQCRLLVYEENPSKCLTPSDTALNRDLLILGLLFILCAFVF